MSARDRLGVLITVLAALAIVVPFALLASWIGLP